MRGPKPDTGTRRCSRCGLVKPLTEFHGHVRRDRGVFEWDTRCRACNRARRTESYRKDPEKARAQTAKARARGLRRGRATLTDEDADRFWQKVNRQGPADCWPWLAGKTRSGYGQFVIRHHGHRAHRIAFTLMERPLERGESISHSCGDRACCNPAHMEIGYDGKGLSAPERFAKYAFEDPKTGCWDWLGGTSADGPFIKSDGRTRLAMRWAWEQEVGAVPRGKVVRRNCANQLCVNPAHAELATPAEVSAKIPRLLPAACVRGHPYPPDARISSSGGRRCKPCEAMAAQRRRALVRELFIEDVDPGVLHRRDGGRCGICGEPIQLSQVNIDHVIPITRGGPHSYANTRPCHRSCNSWKGARLDEELTGRPPHPAP